MSDKKCGSCNGFGYTKGGPAGPWEKLDCDTCNGTGKSPKKCKHELTTTYQPFGDVCAYCGEPVTK